MTDTTGLCRDHSFETAEDVCRRCGGEYCELCLVYPFGVAKPLCKECAIAAAGVRSHVSRPAMPKKDLRRKVKAFDARMALRSGNTAQAAGTDDPVLTDPLAPTEEDLERLPAPPPVPEDGEAFAEELAAAFNSAPSTDDQPADGVAPPIDWSRPFG